MNPAYGKIVSSQGVLEQISSISFLAFAPGLFDVIKFRTPPTITYFKTLPTNCLKRWPVYRNARLPSSA